MKNLKKLMALIIAFAMMLTLVPGVVFADEVTDEEATITEEEVVEEAVEEVKEEPEVKQPVGADAGKYASSVLRAQKFGIMIGDPSGDLKPNNPVTRAEFMTMLVRALGYEEAAVAAKGTTKFADVPAEHWASGYVNVTVQLGVTVGKSETSFAPDDNVTTTEALAFIERAMGYEVLAQEKGGWPTGYLVVAKDRSYRLNLLDGVTDDVNLPALRGLIAKLFDNALAAPFYEVESYSGGVPTYTQDENVTFLTKMGYEKLTTTVDKNVEDEFILVQTPYYGSDDDKVALVPVADRDANTIVKELNGEFDLDALMGTRIEAYVDEDGKIVDIQMTDADKTEKIVADEISKDGKRIKIKNGSEKKYDVVGNKLLYVSNFAYGKADDADAFDKDGAFGDATDLIEATAVIYDGEVDFVYGFKYTEPGLVTQIRNNTVTGEQRIGSEAGIYYINKDKDEKAKFVEIIKNGEEVDIDDIEEDEDIVYVASLNSATADNAKDNRFKILVVNDTLVGELNGVTSDKNDASKVSRVRIDSTNYDVYTPTKLSDWDDNKISVGDTVLARLTKDGKVYSLEFEDGSVSDDYAIVTYIWSEENSKTKKVVNNVTLFKSDGSEVDYVVDDESDAHDDIENKKVKKGDLVKYKLNSDNEVITLDAAEKVDVTANSEKKRVNGLVSRSNIVLFNVPLDYETIADTEEVEVSIVSWDTLKETTTVHAYITDDGFVVAAKLVGAASDVKYGVITERYTIKDDKARFVLITKDGFVEYDSEKSNIDSKYSVGKFIAYSVNADDEIIIEEKETDKIEIRPADGKPVAIDSVDADVIKIDGEPLGFDSDGVIVYYNDGLDPDEDFEVMDKDDLIKYMEVIVYMVDDNVIGVGVAVK